MVPYLPTLLTINYYKVTIKTYNFKNKIFE